MHFRNGKKSQSHVNFYFMFRSEYKLILYFQTMYHCMYIKLCSYCNYWVSTASGACSTSVYFASLYKRRKIPEDFMQAYEENIYTVKPAHEVTSIKQSPVLKGHLFLLLSQKVSCELRTFYKISPVLKELFFFLPKVTS